MLSFFQFLHKCIILHETRNTEINMCIIILLLFIISDPKNSVAKFLALETPIWGGHFRSKKFRRKKSQHFSQKRGGGGGSKAVWNFSKNSSIMVGTGFPKLCWQGNLFGVWNTELGLAFNISSWDSLTFYALA